MGIGVTLTRRRLAGMGLAIGGAGLMALGVWLGRAEIVVLGLAAWVLMTAGLAMGLRYRTATLLSLLETTQSSLAQALAGQSQLARLHEDLRRSVLEGTGLTLRAFRDIARLQQSQSTELEGLVKGLAAVEVDSREAHAVTREWMSKAGQSFQSLEQSASELSPRLEVSDKLMRQVIRDVAALPPKASEVLVAALTPQIETSSKLMRQVIRDVAAGTPQMAKLHELTMKVASDIKAGETRVSAFLGNDKELNNLAHRALTKIQLETMQEAEALLQLHRLFDLQAPVPLLGGWAMEPVSMLALVTEVLRRKPKLVVECGSGTSTLWIAHALRKNGGGRLISIEHLESYARLGAAALDEHGLADIVDLRLAPLERQPVSDGIVPWYAKSAFADLGDIDMLIVDGPPSATGPLARYPALPLLKDRLAPGALLMLDDAGRSDERAVMARWKEEVPGLSESWSISSRTVAFEYRPA